MWCPVTGKASRGWWGVAGAGLQRVDKMGWGAGRETGKEVVHPGLLRSPGPGCDSRVGGMLPAHE